MITKYNYTFLIPSYNRYEKLTNLINQIKDIDDDSELLFIYWYVINISIEHIINTKNIKYLNWDKN